ncbi:hypothetical protein M2299_003158 [Stenotrophomonas sp. 1278]|nr:hypothetical protein [Stenotrophomonas sp. 1278]
MQQSRKARYSGETTAVWQHLASAAACLLTLLMLTPFAPYMPFPGLDGSWNEAMNIATAEHLRFGKDIVFTFGPLASIYTRVYHPATDWMMLAGSLLIAAALFAGLYAAAAPRRRALLLVLPIVISLAWGRDAVYLFVPVLLPFVVQRGLERGRPFTLALCLLAAAAAILPLVKGNFGLLLAMATIVSVLLCWRSCRRTAVMVVVVELVAIIGVWALTGQRLLDLPGYFLAQAPIVSGYTDAMSVVGNLRDIFVFAAVALVLLCISLRTSLRRYWYMPLMLAAYLFVSFKSGFVRHDEHAFVAAVALAYVGLLLCLTLDVRWGVGALLIALIGWGGVTRTYTPVTWAGSTARFAEMVRMPVHGISQRLMAPDVLPERYAGITAAIGKRPPFAGYTGDADVYPVDLGALLGAGAQWKPRPILQSYSAYTPGLIQANAQHLATRPPHRVYFTVDPIDHRYPALDDGASWLSLLGSFNPTALDAGYAVLERPERPTPTLRPARPIERQATLGQDIEVPGWEKPVWVTMDIRPTLVGRLVSTLFKAPKLSLRVTFENGDTADYRLVSGMTQSGFLLSPTVGSAKDFIALRSSNWQALLKGRRVKSLKVSGDRGTSMLWRAGYRVGFSQLDIPAAPEADSLLTPAWQVAQQPSSYEQGGECNIDEVNRRQVSASSVALPAGMATITGWAAIDTATGVANDTAALLLTGADQTSYRIEAIRVPRTDVAAGFSQAGLGFAGYEAIIDTSRMPNEAQIHVIQDKDGRTLLCTTKVLSVHRRDQG